MMAYWAEYGPPVHLSVAGFFGLVKPKEKKGKETGDLRDLVQMFPGGTIQ